ncbi:MAG: FHA domain-containing protein [Aridibacter sp.]
MSAENSTEKKSFSLDWLVGGVLTKLGDTFDRFTGRGWNPSSSLATSELVEKLKFLLDSEVRDSDGKGKYVPHIIKLKMQWNKFSTEAEPQLKKLEHELQAAAIDHINDKLYHTYAPLEIEIKTDYFTEGVRMLASYGKFAENENDEVAVNVSIPNLRTADKDNKITVNLSDEKITIPTNENKFLARFTLNNQPKEIELDFTEKKRISVGRFKENDLSIPDQSVSNVHASLVLSNAKQLKVADTGSTNGTFIGGERIAYGKAFLIADGEKVKFGTIEVEFERLGEIAEDLPEVFEQEELMPTEAIMDLNQTEVQPIIKPLGNSANQATEQIGEFDKTIAEIPATEADLKTFEDKIIKEENIESPPEIVGNDKTEQINIDKTQD